MSDDQAEAARPQNIILRTEHQPNERQFLMDMDKKGWVFVTSTRVDDDHVDYEFRAKTIEDLKPDYPKPATGQAPVYGIPEPNPGPKLPPVTVK